jgi:mitogen-activated protein kinase organizer 1
VTSVSLSTDENMALLSCMDDSLRLLDCSNGSILKTFKGHKNSSAKLNSCFGNQDGFVLSGSEDHNVYIWNVMEGDSPLEVLKDVHASAVSCIRYNGQVNCLLTCSADGKIKVWKSK